MRGRSNIIGLNFIIVFSLWLPISLLVKKIRADAAYTTPTAANENEVEDSTSFEVTVLSLTGNSIRRKFNPRSSKFDAERRQLCTELLGDNLDLDLCDRAIYCKIISLDPSVPSNEICTEEFSADLQDELLGDDPADSHSSESILSQTTGDIYSSFRCIGGSQVLDKSRLRKNQLQGKFPLDDPEFRVCQFNNVCLLYGSIPTFVYFLDPADQKELPPDFRLSGFGHNMLHLGYFSKWYTADRNKTFMPISYQKQPMPRDAYLHSDDRRTAFLSAHSWPNYGHYLIDNIVPAFTAARIFNIPLPTVQQVLPSSCRDLGNVDPLLESNLVPNMTVQESCLRLYRDYSHYFFDHPPTFLDGIISPPNKKSKPSPSSSPSSSSAASRKNPGNLDHHPQQYQQDRPRRICFRKLIAGYGSAFSLKSVDLSRGIILREFRDHVLGRLNYVFPRPPASVGMGSVIERQEESLQQEHDVGAGEDREVLSGDSITTAFHTDENMNATKSRTSNENDAAGDNTAILVPPARRKRVVLVALRGPGGSTPTNANEENVLLCRTVTDAFNYKINNGPHEYEVKCVFPFMLSFETEVEYAQQASIIVTFHGTVSYISMFVRDGTQVISITSSVDNEYGKEHHVLGWTMHFNLLYLEQYRVSTDLEGILSHVTRYLDQL